MTQLTSSSIFLIDILMVECPLPINVKSVSHLVNLFLYDLHKAFPIGTHHTQNWMQWFTQLNTTLHYERFNDLTFYPITFDTTFLAVMLLFDFFKALSLVLDMTPFSFAIELVAFASKRKYLNFETLLPLMTNISHRPLIHNVFHH